MATSSQASSGWPLRASRSAGPVSISRGSRRPPTRRLGVPDRDHGADDRVLVLAAGVPRMFASVERSGHLDTSVLVLGYVIMRRTGVSLLLLVPSIHSRPQDSSGSPPRRGNIVATFVGRS